MARVVRLQRAPSPAAAPEFCTNSVRISSHAQSQRFWLVQAIFGISLQKMYNVIVNTLRFEKLVSSALLSFPKRLRDAISNVAIVIEDFPRQKHTNEIEIGSKGVLLGLYEGVPQTEWGKTQSGVLPDKITIFQQSIESIATDDNSLKKLVRDVVWHEIGHHFGFTDKELRRIENRRKQKSDC